MVLWNIMEQKTEAKGRQGGLKRKELGLVITMSALYSKLKQVHSVMGAGTNLFNLWRNCQ